jgi:hypothetical protein
MCYGQQQGKAQLTIAHCTFLWSAVTISRKARMMEEDAGTIESIDIHRTFLSKVYENTFVRTISSVGNRSDWNAG